MGDSGTIVGFRMLKKYFVYEISTNESISITPTFLF